MIIAPHGNGGVIRYLMALFLLSWLGLRLGRRAFDIEISVDP